MCRLLGFKSSQKSDLNHSLKDAENSILVQSHSHFDGWGIGYYTKPGIPTIHKHTDPAYNSFHFSEVSTKLFADTIIAHIRKATFGAKKIENCHPFTYKEWLFAHNGTLENFQKFKPYFQKTIDPTLKDQILGDTDSEYVFFLFLTFLKKITHLNQLTDPSPIKEALFETISLIDTWNKEIKNPTPPTLNIILTNHILLSAVCRGEPLFYHQHLPPLDNIDQKDTATEREGIKRYVLIVSEKLSKKETWEQMPPNSVLTVNNDFHCEISEIPRTNSPSP